MRRIATLALFVCLTASSAFALEGAWTASREDKRPDRVYFNLTSGLWNNNGMTMSLSAFTNLTAAQIDAQTMTPVTFEMRREAGTIALEGTFRRGKGAGQYTFTPDRSYIDKLRAVGVAFDLEGRHHRRERTEEEDLFTLALHDVSTAYIKSMQNIGYRTTLDKYLEMRIFNITPEYVREMESLGFKDISTQDLIDTKIHNVTPQFVRDMRAAGWDLSLEELKESAIFRATPEFAAEMKKLGYGNLKHDDLVAFRIHHVTAEFINELRELGYEHVDADDLVAMRIHNVTTQFIRELAAAGYKHVPVDKLVDMRIHGVDAKMIKALSDD
jgi:hypothetical protein